MTESGKKADGGEDILIDNDFKCGEVFASERQRALRHIDFVRRKHVSEGRFDTANANECGVVVFLNGRAALRFGGTFSCTSRWPSKSALMDVVFRSIYPVMKSSKEGVLQEFTEKEKYVLYRE